MRLILLSYWSASSSIVCFDKVDCVRLFTEESEMAQARLKGLDSPGPVVTKPQKDVNTFINNQLKFSSSQHATIPPTQMKCNILKAKAEEQYRKGE